MSSNKRRKIFLRSDREKRRSLDRFGDDMCELLLSYLTLNEKFRYECVSKQFRRTIYEKQFQLTEDDMYGLNLVALLGRPIAQGCGENGCKKVLKLKTFESVIRKCSSVQSIVMSNSFVHKIVNYNELFELIAKRCRRLTEIAVNYEYLSEQTIDKFFSKFGSDLKKLHFLDCRLNSIDMIEKKEFFQNSLKLCESLESIVSFEDLSLLFDEYIYNKVLAKNLKTFSFNYMNADSIRIQRFIESNKTLKSINICFGFNLKQKSVYNLMNELTQLTKLQELQITSASTVDQSLGEAFKRFAIECQKFKHFRKLSLILTFSSFKLCLEVLNSIQYFNRLTQLQLILYYERTDTTAGTDKTAFLSNQLFSHCHQLKRFWFEFDIDINDLFFDDIHIHCPELQYLCVLSFLNISTATFDSVSKLQKLQTIYMETIYESSKISNSCLFELMRKCPKLDFFRFDKEDTYVRLNDRRLIEFGQTDEHNNDIQIINESDSSDDSSDEYDTNSSDMY